MLSLLESLVSIPGTVGGSGIIKYIGPIRGKVGTFAGIELDNSTAAARGRNSGDVDGVQYFDVSSPGAGLFLPWERLRSVNTHLPPTVTSFSRTSGAIEHASTPSPISRAIGSRLSSSAASDDKVAIGRDSPLLVTPKLQVPKRRVSSKDLYRPNHQTPRAVSASYVSNIGMEKSAEKVIDALKRELNDTKLLLECKNNALTEKSAILNELQTTVNELNPILQDYENAIAEKERKMLKQKQEYEAAREEWRQSLDLMLNAQQETEQLYELELNDLKEELATLAAKKRDTTNLMLPKKEQKIRNEKVDILELELNRVMKELASTQSALDTASIELSSLRALSSPSSKQTDDLIVQLDSLSIQGSGLPSEIDELKIKLEQKGKEADAAIQKLQDVELACEEQIAKLKFEKDQIIHNLTRENAKQADHIKELTDSIDSLKTSSRDRASGMGTSAQLEKAQSLIQDLQHQLEMRPSFDELTELQESMDIVDNLHQKELLHRNNEIKRLQSECDQLSSELKKLRAINIVAKLELFEELDLPPAQESLVTSSLQIHVPVRTTDASAGRVNWCGLCEREGHSSLECPFENDIF